jgi:polyphosphate glucokinase
MPAVSESATHRRAELGNGGGGAESGDLPTSDFRLPSGDLDIRISGILGIDIGGSGMKGNLVNPLTGELMADRFKAETPQPSIPEAVAVVVRQIVDHFEYEGPVGCTFPAIVKGGVTLSAANVDQAWIGCHAAELFSNATGHQVIVVNDADAAGIAEMAVGAGRDRPGVTLLLTFGTGIGSAMFHNGVLIPNTELGHLEFKGYESVEDWAAAKVKDDENLSWKSWAGRVNQLLEHLVSILSPDLFILGGGVSRRWEKWGTYLDVPVETIPAALRNEAGIVGAALWASSQIGANPVRLGLDRGPDRGTQPSGRA